MTTESKVVCELVDSLLSQPTLLEAITKNLDAPRNLPANTNSNNALSSTSVRNECSESVSISNYNTRFQNRAQDEEDEVRHMFSRGRSSTQLEPCNPAANSNQCSPRPDLNSAMHFPMYHFTRNFGRQKYQRAQQPKYNKRLFRGPSMFTKEIILLPGPHDQIVVKQGTKQFLYESGHIITTFEFDKMWTSNEVQEHLHRAFSPKLDNVDIQLLMPCHNKLVKPLLMNEQTLSGLLISKIFKQKSVYLLPSKQILEVPEKSLQDKDVEEKSDLIAWLDSGNINEYPAEAECALKVGSPVGHPITTSLSATTVEEITVQTTATSIQQHPENIVEITSSFQTTSREFPNDFQPTESHDDTKQGFNENYRQYTELLDYGHIPDEDELDNSSINITDEIDGPESESNDITLKDLLSNLALQIDCEKISKFNINRRDIWDGARRGFLRKTFKATNRLSVVFTDTAGKSEGAVDYGGPTREFLRLLMRHLQNCKLFEGHEIRKHSVVMHMVNYFDVFLRTFLKVKGIRNDDYYLAGQAMAVSLVHGGPAPSFFSPHLYSCLMSDTKSVHPRLEDVPDPETQEMLREIEHAISLEMLQATIQKHSTILSVAGCLRGVKSLGEKYELSQDFIDWYLVGRMMPSLERFKDGLRQLGVLQAMEIHKQIFEEAFVWIKKIITADTVDAIFEVSFSPAGSNSRTLEEKVVGYWRDYLQDCEELVCEAKLQDILCFVTGADVIPPLGLSPQPSIEFLHNCDQEKQPSKFPEANTCGNVLRLPLFHSYEEFKESMDFAILNSPGFGRA